MFTRGYIYELLSEQKPLWISQPVETYGHRSGWCFPMKTSHDIPMTSHPHEIPSEWGPILNFVDQVGLILLIAGVLVCLGIFIKIRLIGQMLLGLVKAALIVSEHWSLPQVIVSEWETGDEWWMIILSISCFGQLYIKWCFKPPTFGGTIFQTIVITVKDGT